MLANTRAPARGRVVRASSLAFIAPSLLVAASHSALAQTADSARAAVVPSGAFVAFIKNAVDGSAVRSVDVRLLYLDSARAVHDSGADGLETFIDTVRSRLRVSDSTGYVSLWHVAPGRYLMHARRIGFSPSEAIVTIDSETVLYEFTMDPVSTLLSKVEIRETATDAVSERLDHVGFSNRYRFRDVGDFYRPQDFQKRRPQTLRDILDVYGLRGNSADYLMDRMPLEYADIMDYPAEQIAGIEVYRHGRPVEFNATMNHATLLASGGQNTTRPLVVIWTY